LIEEEKRNDTFYKYFVWFKILWCDW